jgi:hypothetical protein
MSLLDHERSIDGGRRRRLTGGLATLAAVAVIAGGAAAASASSALPVSPALPQASAANHGLRVEPATIIYTGDGTGFLGGAGVRDESPGIHWTKWTSDVALGTGFNQLNDCIPSCAGGRYHGYQVKIAMWRPRTRSGMLLFTRLTIYYEHGRPPGEPHHYTFTDVYIGGLGGGFSWGPPTEQGYCVHTFGLPAAAGCNNIHELP